MKVVLTVFVMAFLVLTGAGLAQSGGPQLDCDGSSVDGYIDYASGTDGPSSPREAALEQMVDEGDHVTSERLPSAPQLPDCVFRSYDGERLLEIVEIRRDSSGDGWLATKHTRC